MATIVPIVDCVMVFGPTETLSLNKNQHRSYSILYILGFPPALWWFFRYLT